MNEATEERILNVSLIQNITVDSRLQEEVAAFNSSNCDVLELVAQSLHNIAPNVILAKREVRVFIY